MNPTPKYLVSIHDVMPESLERVIGIFDRLEHHGLLPVTLLVVPGREWSDKQLERLQGLIERGGELAGHGWCHEVSRVRGLRHRLHSALISKNVAEHLALAPAGRVDLMQRCHRWFVDQGLPVPSLYVPPAWAMGPLPSSELDALPFDLFETLSGVYDSAAQRFHPLPLLGFEAASLWQGLVVRPWNGVNRQLGLRLQRPIRFGVHPDDFSHRLSDQLEGYIARGGESLSYRQLV